MRRAVSLGGFAAVRHRDRVLLVKQGYGFELWGFPGGAVEEGETLAEATRREVLEETGINVELEGLIASWERPDLALFVFLATPLDFVLTAQESEIADIGWFTASEVKTLQPGFASHRAVALRVLESTKPRLLPPSVVENPAGDDIAIWAGLRHGGSAD